MPENNFNKVSTLWACQTYMENMSKVLKPGEILFGVLFFRQILRQLRTFLKLLPKCIFVGSLRNHKKVFLQIATNDNVTTNKLMNHKRDSL